MMPDGGTAGELFQQRERLEQVFRQSKSMQQPASGELHLVVHAKQHSNSAITSCP